MALSLAIPVLVFGAIAAAVAEEPRGQLVVRWYGQACFELRFPGGLVALADPFEKKVGYDFPGDVKPDVVTVSHEHFDHNNVKEVAGSPKVLRGLTDADPRKQDWARIDETVKGVRIRTYKTYHDKEKGTKRGKNAVFVFEEESSGARVVHLGDLGHPIEEDKPVALLHDATVLLIPVGGTFTIDAAEAQSIASALSPSHAVVPMHFKTKRLDPGLPLATVEGFLKWEKCPFASRTVDENQVSFDPKKKPVKPEIVVLGYESRK